MTRSADQPPRRRNAGPPVDPGPNPAEMAGDAAVRRMIRDGRARNVSWANLSKMTGRSEADLRRLWGAGMKSAAKPWAGRKPAAITTTRADWRALAALALKCAGEATADGPPADASSLIHLGARASRSDPRTLDREAGFVVGATARALAGLAAAFAGSTTSADQRRALAPAVTALAELLDERLHALNASEFQRAHQGRPEVWR